MPYESTGTKTVTYTVTDVENVVRRLSADFNMIAECTGAMSASLASDFVNDICLFAICNVLEYADVTLLRFGSEVRACRYEVDTRGGINSNERPGGVLWPYCPEPIGSIRIIVGFSKESEVEDVAKVKKRCKLNWENTVVDCSHSFLSSTTSRQYSSGSYGMNRLNWK